MQNKSQKSFKHLFSEDKNSQKITSLAKKSIAIIFLLFLLLFQRYTPYGNSQNYDPSLLHSLFNLYFFIFYQTFGIVHEGGHGVCYILSCPQFFTALNGTIFQIGFPLGIAYYYKKALNPMLMWIGIFFTGLTTHYTSWYISTAHMSKIVPASQSFLGVDGFHDFNYLLDTLGILAYDGILSTIVKIIAYGLMSLAVWKMLGLAFSNENNN